MRLCKRCHKLAEANDKYPCTFEEHGLRALPGGSCEQCGKVLGRDGGVECRSHQIGERHLPVALLMPFNC